MSKTSRSIGVIFIIALLFQCSCSDNPSDNTTKNLKIESTSKLPANHYFYSVHFMNDDIGWAVGKNGTIYKHTSKNSKWQPQGSGTTDDLIRVQFIDSQTGWAAGAHSILYTNNGGESWQTQLSGLDFSSFLDIYFYDKNTGWASGTPDGKVYYTTDAGNTWSVQQADTMGRVVNLCFVDRNNGYSLNNVMGIYKTTDGGQNWIIMHHPRFCSTVSFLDMNTGLAGNNVMASSIMPDQAKIFITNDGGNTWSDQNIPVSEAVAVWKVAFMNSSTGFAFAGDISSFSGEAKDFVETGKLIYTTNSGKLWQSAENLLIEGTPADFNKVVDFSFYGKNKLCILTLDGNVFQVSISQEIL